jgi:UDP-glucose 6-dehydrogenase
MHVAIFGAGYVGCITAACLAAFGHRVWLVELPGRFGTDVTFALNPEFLREGQALEDFQHPPFVIVGMDHPVAAQKLQELYRPLAAPYLVVAPGTASLLKYACNAFHAMKIAFANEASLLCPTPEAALYGTQLVIVGKMLLSEAQLQTLCPAGKWVLDLTHQLPTHLPPLRLLRFNSAAAAASAARYGC